METEIDLRSQASDTTPWAYRFVLDGIVTGRPPTPVSSCVP